MNLDNINFGNKTHKLTLKFLIKYEIPAKPIEFVSLIKLRFLSEIPPKATTLLDEYFDISLNLDRPK